jgi:predicted Zn-dependent peptidase
MRHFKLLLLAALCFSPAQNLAAQDLKAFEKKVTEFTLPNGLHFIVVERHEAPVASFHTYVNAGSVNEPNGRTGLAHMFEHMAFKGTQSIGTTNWPAERKALEAVEAIYDRLESEEAKEKRADPAKLKALSAELDAAIQAAQAYVVPNEYPRIIEENGGAGLNASTGVEATNYYYSLPSNRTELWFLLESQRFLRPVFREFYKERDVVREERRMRIESNPQGKLIETMLATAFMALPYRHPTTGWASDIDHLRVEDARVFFEQFYVPRNMVIGIVGDVDPAAIRRLAERYFGPMPDRPLPPPLTTLEPPQSGEKRAAVETPSQPFLTVGYKRPAQDDPDDPVFDVISTILASGRTGTLYKELVRDKRIALAAQSAAVFPAGEYSNLFLFFLVPNSGRSLSELETACYEIVDRLKTEKVDAATLERVKTKVRASIIRQLDSNTGLASQLTWYYMNYGDWRKLFTALQDIERVTADDVQRVAKKYFNTTSRTVAFTVPPGGATQPAAAPAPGAPPKPAAPAAKEPAR